MLTSCTNKLLTIRNKLEHVVKILKLLHVSKVRALHEKTIKNIVFPIYSTGQEPDGLPGKCISIGLIHFFIG